MTKELAILHITKRIMATPEFSALQVVDYWEADLCAIGFESGSKLIYISTYNYSKPENQQYDCDLELGSDDLKKGSKLVKELRGVLENELFKEIRMFI